MWGGNLGDCSVRNSLLETMMAVQTKTGACQNSDCTIIRMWCFTSSNSCCINIPSYLAFGLCCLGSRIYLFLFSWPAISHLAAFGNIRHLSFISYFFLCYTCAPSGCWKVSWDAVFCFYCIFVLTIPLVYMQLFLFHKISEDGGRSIHFLSQLIPCHSLFAPQSMIPKGTKDWGMSCCFQQYIIPVHLQFQLALWWYCSICAYQYKLTRN